MIRTVFRFMGGTVGVIVLAIIVFFVSIFSGLSSACVHLTLIAASYRVGTKLGTTFFPAISKFVDRFPT